MPRRCEDANNHSAALIITYFHPWARNPDLADEHVPSELVRSAIFDPPILAPGFEATAVARVALDGGPDLLVHSDPARLMPIYPREPEAVRRWRERPAR